MTEEENLDLSTMDMILLACCPVDRSNLPQGPELDAIVITELYTLDQCANPDCQFGGDIWVGPRQLATYRQYEPRALLCCYVCAVLVQEEIGMPVSSKLTSLGGGYPTEGLPRRG
jgi:hypothetical protein